MTACPKLGLSVLACLVPLAGAYADDASAGPQTLAAFPPGEERCFAGEFTPQRKDQVTRLMLYRLLRPNPTYEFVEDDAAAIAARDRKADDTVPVSVIARFNDSKKDFVQDVLCHDDAGGIGCYVECDGGSLAAARIGDGLKVTFDDYGMVVRGGCGDEEEVTRMLQAKHFPPPGVLASQPVEACAAADRDAALSFSRDLTPLRERIARAGWTCLKRSYTADHLRRNPKQKVKSIAVAVALKTTPAEGGGTDTEIAATAEIRLRDGRTAKKTLSCYAMPYEFTCDNEFRLKRRDAKTALLLQGASAPDPGEPEPAREMLGLKLGAGDDVFRLEASTAATCEAE